MSRTDKTKPWRVKIAEHDPVAVHHHQSGVCTLPDDPLDSPDYSGCYWSSWGLDHADCCRFGCSCDRCWGSSRRARVRSERLAARQAARRAAEFGEPVVGRVKKRKDTRRWCKGKEGRAHVLEVRDAHWASWRRGRTCYLEPAGSHWRAGTWTCYHEVGCAVCGKILRTTASKYDCPTWRSLHRITASTWALI